MTYSEVLKDIEYRIGICGSARALARHWHISVQYLCDVRKGRRQPGPCILKAMGLKRETTFRHIYKRARP